MITSVGDQVINEQSPYPSDNVFTVFPDTPSAFTDQPQNAHKLTVVSNVYHSTPMKLSNKPQFPKFYGSADNFALHTDAVRLNCPQDESIRYMARNSKLFSTIFVDFIDMPAAYFNLNEHLLDDSVTEDELDHFQSEGGAPLPSKVPVNSEPKNDQTRVKRQNCANTPVKPPEVTSQPFTNRPKVQLLPISLGA